ncbi:hypothetical protein niasHT_032647 [Heterodera trifolii]|uniref:Uncharacterized protein n=1 Tax=Heterodera trifolii TaxID=157864 RepID=A0ABD2IVW6_9BILA
MVHNSGTLLPPALFGFLLLFFCCGELSLFAYGVGDYDKRFECKHAKNIKHHYPPYEHIKSILTTETTQCKVHCGAQFCSTKRGDGYELYHDFWSCFDKYTDEHQCALDHKLDSMYSHLTVVWECQCRFGHVGVAMSNENFIGYQEEMGCRGQMITENGTAVAPFAPGNVVTCFTEHRCVAVFCAAGELFFHLWTCSYNQNKTCAKDDGPKSANDERAKLGLKTSTEWNCICQFGAFSVAMGNALFKPPKDEVKCQSVIVTEDATVNNALNKKTLKKDMNCAYSGKHCAMLSCSAGPLKFDERICTNATTENECAKVPAKINAKRKNLSLPTTEDWNCTCKFVTEKVPSDDNHRNVGNGFGMILPVPILLGILSLFHADIFGRTPQNRSNDAQLHASPGCLCDAFLLLRTFAIWIRYSYSLKCKVAHELESVNATDQMIEEVRNNLCPSAKYCFAAFCSSAKTGFYKNSWSCAFHFIKTKEECEAQILGTVNFVRKTIEDRTKISCPSATDWKCTCHIGANGKDMDNEQFVAPVVELNPKEVKCQSVIVTEDATVNNALKKETLKKEMKCAYDEKHCAMVSCSAGLLKFDERICTNATTENECAKVPAKINAKRKNLSLPTTEDWNCTCQFVTEKVPPDDNHRNVGNGFGMILPVPILLGILSLFHADIFGSA